MPAPLHLSCGQCKRVRTFSGTPPACEVCGWVCDTSDTSYWQNLRAARQQPVAIQPSGHRQAENQNNESGESSDRSASGPNLEALFDRVAKLEARNEEQPLLDDSEWPINENDLSEMGVRGASLPPVTKGMQVLMEAGLAPEDVADVIYDHPGVLDALKIGEYDKAKLLSFRFISEHLMQLRECGVSEDRLLVLSESGLAVGEISFAIQHVIGCRDGLIETDADGLKLRAKTLYEFYRQSRLTRRPLCPQKPFFERYAELFDTPYWRNLRAQRQQSASSPEQQALLDSIAKLGAQKDDSKPSEPIRLATVYPLPGGKAGEVSVYPPEYYKRYGSQMEESARKLKEEEERNSTIRWIAAIAVIIFLIWLLGSHPGNPDCQMQGDGTIECN